MREDVRQFRESARTQPDAYERKAVRMYMGRMYEGIQTQAEPERAHEQSSWRTSARVSHLRKDVRRQIQLQTTSEKRPRED